MKITREAADARDASQREVQVLQAAMHREIADFEALFKQRVDVRGSAVACCCAVQGGGPPLHCYLVLQWCVGACDCTHVHVYLCMPGGSEYVCETALAVWWSQGTCVSW
jgi:hypothetical protein